MGELRKFMRACKSEMPSIYDTVKMDRPHLKCSYRRISLTLKQQNYARCEAPVVSLSNSLTFTSEIIMSILSLNLRPLMVFDAANNQHRKYYAEFVKRRTWGYCPIRFMVDGHSQTDLVTHIERCLVDYYTMKEFKVKNTLR